MSTHHQQTDLYAEPPEDPAFAPFWEAFEHERIALPRCSRCGRFQWYPEEAGADCDDAMLEWVDVATTGTVYTLTTVRRSFLPGLGDGALPIVVGLVELDGVDGVRLVANLERTVGIGDRVLARFDRTTDRRVRPVFVAARDDGGDRAMHSSEF